MKKGMVAGIVVVLGVIGFLLINLREEPSEKADTSASTVIEPSETSATERKELPTFSELTEEYGESLVDKGEYKMITAFYQENPRVQLKNEQGDLLELAITAVEEDGETVTFSIESLETINNRKRIGELIKLAQNEDTYYEYQ